MINNYGETSGGSRQSRANRLTNLWSQLRVGAMNRFEFMKHIVDVANARSRQR